MKNEKEVLMPRFKDGVDHTDMSDNITRHYDRIDKIHNKHVDRDALITSARDGEHKTDSLHYSGKAIDLRTRDMDTGIARKVTRDIQNELGRDYDVILEHNHIHLEYDPD